MDLAMGRGARNEFSRREAYDRIRPDAIQLEITLNYFWTLIYSRIPYKSDCLILQRRGVAADFRFAREFILNIRHEPTVDADLTAVGRWEDDQEFEQQELTVDADRTGEEERRVHHQPHQRGEHGERAENQAEPDKEFAQRNDDVEPFDAGERGMLEEYGPPILNRRMLAGGFGDGSLHKSARIEASR